MCINETLVRKFVITSRLIRVWLIVNNVLYKCNPSKSATIKSLGEINNYLSNKMRADKRIYLYFLDSSFISKVEKHCTKFFTYTSDKPNKSHPKVIVTKNIIKYPS